MRFRVWSLGLAAEASRRDPGVVGGARKLSLAPSPPYHRCPRVFGQGFSDIETGMTVRGIQTRERRACGRKRDTLARGAGSERLRQERSAIRAQLQVIGSGVSDVGNYASRHASHCRSLGSCARGGEFEAKVKQSCKVTQAYQNMCDGLKAHLAKHA